VGPLSLAVRYISRTPSLEPTSRVQVNPVSKIPGRHPSLALGLYLLDTNPGFPSASHGEAFMRSFNNRSGFIVETGRLRVGLESLGSPKRQPVSFQCRIAAGPGLEPASSVRDPLGAVVPINPAVFALQHRCIRRLSVILCFRFNESPLNQRQGLGQKVSTEARNPDSKLRSRLVGAYVDASRGQHRTSIHPCIHLHDGDAGLFFSVRNCPVYWRGASVFWQQRGVNIYAAKSRYREQPRGQNFSIGRDDANIRRYRLENCSDLVVVL